MMRYLVRPGRLAALGYAITGRMMELDGERVIPLQPYPGRHARPPGGWRCGGCGQLMDVQPGGMLAHPAPRCAGIPRQAAPSDTRPLP